MNKEKRGVLVGMSIGDGYLQTTIRAIVLKIEHSTKQAAYLEHKRNRLAALVGGKIPEIHVRHRFDKRTNKTYSTTYFTKSIKYFKILKKYLYPNGKKTYSERILKRLTPEGIAYWYMDDGSAKTSINKRTGKISSCQTYLCTYCSSKEADIIIEYFVKYWNIKFQKHFHKPCNAFNVCANTENSIKFVELIKPFIIPSMLYKINHVPTSIVHECLAPKG